jgi:hypothetical protein
MLIQFSAGTPILDPSPQGGGKESIILHPIPDWLRRLG